MRRGTESGARLGRAVPDHRVLPREGEARGGRRGGRVETEVPRRVAVDGLPLRLGDCNLPRALRRARREHHRAAHVAREEEAPLEGLHAARRAADHGVHAAHAEALLEQQLVQPHRVADGRVREVGGVARAGRLGVRASAGRHPRRPRGHLVERAGRSVARAEHVGADHEVAARVERPAVAEQLGPPRVDRRVARERVGDEEGVVGARGERPPRPKGDAHVAQRQARLELKRGQVEVGVVLVQVAVLVLHVGRF